MINGNNFYEINSLIPNYIYGEESKNLKIIEKKYKTLKIRIQMYDRW